MSSVTERQPPAPAPPSRPARRIPRIAIGVAVVGVLMFLVGLIGGSYQGKLTEVQKNDNAAYLPATAESTRVANEQQRFTPIETVPGFVAYQRTGGLTAADRAKISADVDAFRRVDGVAADQVPPPQFSADGTTA